VAASAIELVMALVPPLFGANRVPRATSAVGLISFSSAVLKNSPTCAGAECQPAFCTYRSVNLERQSLTGIAAASGTNTDSRSSETPPEPYEESAKAEQPRPTTTVRKTHSVFVEQNLPKRKPESVEVGSVSSTAACKENPA